MAVTLNSKHFGDEFDSSLYVRRNAVGWLGEVARAAWVLETSDGRAISCGRLTWFSCPVLHSLAQLIAIVDVGGESFVSGHARC